MPATQRNYQALASVAGEDVPLASFSLQAPSAALGVRGDIRLASPSAAVERGDSFNLTIKRVLAGEDPEDYPKTRLIKNGLVVGTDRTIAAAHQAGVPVPADTLSFVATDKAGKRWRYAPRAPVILYDPESVTVSDSELDSNILDDAGEKILGEGIEFESLDLLQVLQWVYVEQLGFDEVITNLPNYPIPRADFPVTTNFHAVAAALYSFFKPVVFEDDDRLFILDVFGEIPEGLLTGARDVPVGKFISYQRRQPENAEANAVLLTHKEPSLATLVPDEFPPNVTTREESDPPTISGSILDGDYRSVVFTRLIAEFHDDPDDEDKITSEVTYGTRTTTTAQIESGALAVVSREEQIDTYTFGWRLQVGYVKNIEARVEDGSGSVLMQNVITETEIMTWRPSARRAGEWEKLRSDVRAEGLFLIEEDDEGEIKTPLLDASRNNLLTNEDDEIERGPLWTKSTIWTETGPDQIQAFVTKYDFLNKRYETGSTTDHVGTNHVRLRDGEAYNSKQVLIFDEDDDLAMGPIEPITFDAGYVSPYAIARELALRTLEEVREPRDICTVQLATYDAGIRRGSVRNLIDRDNNALTVMVTGYQLSGLPVVQTIEAVVLPAAA